MACVKSIAPTQRQVEIGARIRDIRLRKKLRQVDVAASAGVSWRHLIRMEQGEGGTAKTETLDRVAAALGVERTDLTGVDEEDDEESDPVSDLQQALRRYADYVGHSPQQRVGVHA